MPSNGWRSRGGKPVRITRPLTPLALRACGTHQRGARAPAPLECSCTYSVSCGYLGIPGTWMLTAKFPRLPSVGWGGESAKVVANGTRTGEASHIASGQKVPPGIRRAWDGLADGERKRAPKLTPEQEDTPVE
ncbi:uncharacterized protein PGTG_16358 [Puccinia graminis f. sp. tritici CRL 75-36-700-3]|uniref:Uncharacterized protein n=1 Tax=Puccinia graminis f. sp. tritici (strain CRL 75-36-700-3 / race SCCL) TaxID=418459 RepID=E3L158_PUCGT|nr:uncharacterized protein PGTG_16358 [Puccinia graminis f. sp. tritici CRL 75-36-700-3]EFP90332.2 hypothetical protein PGTG_16358 [Puccinia graminis f. sp. tritici CRL 75-36-700-3]